MSTQMGGYQGAKRSRGGTTASIRNAERRPFRYSPFGQARNRAPGVVAATLRGTSHAAVSAPSQAPDYGPVRGSF
jgi:hypothetical protein